MYSFAQKKFGIFPFALLAISSFAVLSSVQTASKPQSSDQPSKGFITGIGNARSPFNEQTKPFPTAPEAGKEVSFTFQSTKADSTIDCQASIKGSFYTKC